MLKEFIVYFGLAIGLASAQICFDSNSRPGNCVSIAKCPHVLEEFHEQARRLADNINFQSFVSQSICGFDGFNFLICCTIRPNAPDFPHHHHSNTWYSQYPSSIFQFGALGSQGDTTLVPSLAPATSSAPMLPTRATSIPTTTRAILTTKPTAPVDPIPASSILLLRPIGPSNARKGECGISSGATNRVVGGMETKRGTYPWIVALGYYDQPDPTTLKFFCAGSLLSSTYVLTSAHCINPTLAMVRLGAHDLSKTESTAIDVDIKRKVVHGKYDLKTISNDIAMIQLNDAVSFTDFIRPICLPEDSKFMQQDFVGSNPFVAGWGSVQYQGAGSNVLRNAQVPVIQTKTCMENYSTVFQAADVTNTVICAGDYRVDACQGDSGGPLMMPQLEGKIFRYYLIGLVSYGYDCARAGYPGVYTRVAAYMQWIKKNMS